MTPEEYFLDEAAQPFARTFDPLLYLDDIPKSSEPLAPDRAAYEKKNSLDIVLFCGSPGAGKSTFYWNVLEPLSYERVNQDTLKTVRFSTVFTCLTNGGVQREKCLKVAADHLSAKRSVAVGQSPPVPCSLLVLRL